ncbi:hypothetical protein A2U01_0025017, partial [Trifolium medium]|nr:hypothetical protein [Trifolium medium]
MVVVVVVARPLVV